MGGASERASKSKWPSSLRIDFIAILPTVTCLESARNLRTNERMSAASSVKQAVQSKQYKSSIPMSATSELVSERADEQGFQIYKHQLRFLSTHCDLDTWVCRSVTVRQRASAQQACTHAQVHAKCASARGEEDQVSIES